MQVKYKLFLGKITLQLLFVTKGVLKGVNWIGLLLQLQMSYRNYFHSSW
jgi:hypothetical protein